MCTHYSVGNAKYSATDVHVLFVILDKMTYSTVVTIYLESWKFGVFGPKISPKNQPHISFSIVWQYWFGIAKPKNITQKLASHFLFNSLAVLVRHGHANNKL